MPKIRSMSAGRAGASLYNSNVNGNQGGGDKKVNVTELLSDISSSLKDINVTFKEMSGVLQKMALNNASQ